MAIATSLGLPVGTVSSWISKAGLGWSRQQRDARRLAQQSARLWSMVDKSGGDDACWPFTGCRTPLGYGKLSFDIGSGRKTTLASRAAWFCENGPLPAGAVVRHSCDNPPCCNPHHLIVGSRRENSQDALERKRLRYGERHPYASLTVQQAAEIKHLAAKGELSQREIADRFGMHQVRVSQIHTGKIWARAIADLHAELAR